MKQKANYCRDCGAPLSDKTRSPRTQSRCNNCERIIWEGKNRAKGHQTRAARAQLNKAAPELLEALEELLKTEESPHSETARYLAREQAREAIKKAKGE